MIEDENYDDEVVEEKEIKTEVKVIRREIPKI